MSIIQRITEFLTTGSNALSRQIRVVTQRVRRYWSKPTRTWARPDYEFWRDAYYCRAHGLEISGLFIKPLVSKIAGWTLGQAPDWKTERETTGTALADWWSDNHARILRAHRAALTQGDSFVVINSDLSVTVLPPDTVDPIVSEADFGEIVGWRVTQVLPHPERVGVKMTVTDEYHPDRRLHRVQIDGITREETVFPNLLDRLQIVHIPNAPDDDDAFGHAEAEALVEMLHRYGAVMEAALEGNQVQGRPTPVLSFETRQDLDAFWELYGKRERYTNPDGTTGTSETLEVDLNQILTVSGATFTYEAPGSFSQDTERLLGLLFYLYLQHAEIPEFVMGNAISSSKASAETQMPVFEAFINMRRGDMATWLIEIAEIVLGYLSLMQPGVRAETPALQWPKLMGDDGRLTLETVQWGYAEGLLDEQTALMLAPVDIEDISGVLDKARAERETRFPELGGPSEPEIDRQLRDEIESLEI